MTWEDGTMCGEWDPDRILDHLRGRLPAEESARFTAHASSCAACRAAAKDLQAFADLAERPALQPGPATEDAVLAVIRREAARRSQTASKDVKPPTRRRLRRLAGPSTSTATAWTAAAAAVFVIVLLAALSKSPPPSRATALRPAPISEPSDLPPVEFPKPPDRVTPTVPPAPPPPPLPRPAPVADPVEVPRTPPIERPAPSPPEPKSATTTVVEARPSPAVVAQVARGAAKTDRGALAVGDKVLAGETLRCPAGTLLLETADRSQFLLKAGTTLTADVAGEHLTIQLSEGDVACSVKSRPERRFVVATAHGSVTVKGTIFAVRAGSAGTSVSVAKGRVEARTDSGAQEVTGGERCAMSRSTMPGKPEAINADRQFAWAYDAGLQTPGLLWIPALSPAAEFQAPMTHGRAFAAGSLTGEPVYAAVDSRTLPGWNGRSLTSNQKEGGWVTYMVDVPEAGPWYLWGRFYNPASGTALWRQDGEIKDNDPNSFFVSVDGGKESVFGNHKADSETKTSFYHRWHWGGDGKVEIGPPAALPLGTLTKGRHAIRIRNRDAVETSTLHLAPRLDALCLSQDRDYRPRDEDFRK